MLGQRSALSCGRCHANGRRAQRPVQAASHPAQLLGRSTTSVPVMGTALEGVSGRSAATSLPAAGLGRSRRGARGAVRVQAFFNKLFKSDPSAATRQKYQARVDQINAMEPAMQALNDDQLRAKTTEFKDRVRKGESLESILPEAFAVRDRAAREVSLPGLCAARTALCRAERASSPPAVTPAHGFACRL
jgi:hypothetical protein